MRVMLVTGEYPPDEGGVADYTRCLAEALVAEGVEVVVATSGGDRTTAEDEAAGAAVGDIRALPEAAEPDASGAEGGGITVRRGGTTGHRDGITVHRDGPAWGWSTLRWMRTRARSLDADWVHIQYQAAAYSMRPAIHLAPWFLASSVDVRTAVTYHDLREPYLFPKAGSLRRWAVRALARFSDLSVTTNADDFSALEAWGGANRLSLIPIGSNVPDAPPEDYDRNVWRRAAGVGADADLVAYFGFLNTSKGARDLAAALGGLVDSGHDARLVMIGGQVGASDPTNATYLESFRSDLASRSLADRVIWTGHVPATEVSAWLHAADVAALPYTDGASYRRGSLLAALAHGVPIVTTQPTQSPAFPGAPPELVDGESARLVPPGDAGALTSVLSEVLRDRSMRERLSDGARALSVAFGWPAIARTHVSEYETVSGDVACRDVS